MYTMSDRFSIEVMKVGVAKICNRLGFDTADGHAFDTLVDVVGKYIETLGILSKTLAEHDGRTKCEFADVLQAFETMEPHRIEWKDLIRMTDEMMWDVAFASGIPEYPIESSSEKSAYGSQASTSGEPLPFYVPHIFPSFPEPHTYQQTLVNATTPIEDPTEILQATLEQNQLARKALANIHQRDVHKVAEDSLFGDLDSSAFPGQEPLKLRSTSNIDRNLTPPNPASAFS